MSSIGGVWWRHLPHDGNPLHRADPPTDGRWQHGDAIGALYFAKEEETAWAEWYRGLAELGMPLEMSLPRDLWRYKIRLDDIVDLSTDAALAEQELQHPQPTRRQWPAFQQVGEAHWKAGAKGILYESAARPGSLALCVFTVEEAIAALQPIPPRQVFASPPTLPPGAQT